MFCLRQIPIKYNTKEFKLIYIRNGIIAYTKMSRRSSFRATGKDHCGWFFCWELQSIAFWPSLQEEKAALETRNGASLSASVHHYAASSAKREYRTPGGISKIRWRESEISSCPEGGHFQVDESLNGWTCISLENAGCLTGSSINKKPWTSFTKFVELLNQCRLMDHVICFFMSRKLQPCAVYF